MDENTRKPANGKPSPNPSSGAEKHPLLTEIPFTVYAYFHRCIFFITAHLSTADKCRLRKLGFSVRLREWRKADNGTWFRPAGHKLCITFFSREALRSLIDLKYVTPYSAELALDILYGRQAAVLVFQDIRDSIAQPNQQGDVVVSHGTTLYTGQRVDKDKNTGRFKKSRPRNLVCAYADMPSKVTNEPGCVHIEHRQFGLPMLRATGIESVEDMLAFDLAAYWRDYIGRLFLHIDFERYGRAHDNGMKGIKRRYSKTTVIGKQHIYNFDAARGGILFRNFSLHEKKNFRSMQRFVQQVGRDPRFLFPIPVENITNRIEQVWEPIPGEITDNRSNISSRNTDLPKRNPVLETKTPTSATSTASETNTNQHRPASASNTNRRTARPRTSTSFTKNRPASNPSSTSISRGAVPAMNASPSSASSSNASPSSSPKAPSPLRASDVMRVHSLLRIDPKLVTNDPLRIIESWIAVFRDGSECEMVRLHNGEEMSARAALDLQRDRSRRLVDQAGNRIRRNAFPVLRGRPPQ